MTLENSHGRNIFYVIKHWKRYNLVEWLYIWCIWAAFCPLTEILGNIMIVVAYFGFNALNYNYDYRTLISKWGRLH